MDLQELVEDVERHAPGDEPLHLLMAAAMRSEHLTDLADQLLDHFVQAARTAGCSWAQIGETLGVSKQAAQQRHRRTEGDLDDLVAWMKRQDIGRRRFDRFTQRARRAVVEAQDAARRLNHDEVGTEHVLLGLLGDDQSIAAQLLAGWSVTRDDVSAAVEAHRGQGEDPPEGHIPFSAGCKKALDLTLREALALGHNYIGTEHILLGLVHDKGLAGQILRDHDVTTDMARKAVVAALEGLTR
jgi:hypothetical protein